MLNQRPGLKASEFQGFNVSESASPLGLPGEKKEIARRSERS
jgi:hypothetical protein